MNIDEVIEVFVNSIDDACYVYNKNTRTIEKKTIFVSGFVEQNQMIRIIELLDQFDLKYEIEIDGSIKLL